jgi:hypothetical protein
MRLVAPVANRVQENLQNQAADEITRFAKKYIGRALSGGGPDPETSAEGEVEIDAAAAPEVINEDEAQAEELQEKFGVQLSSALSRELTGADASLVRAYEAVLWRLAVLASWERRSIAIAGAPQGSEWMTICRPHEVGRVIAPSRIWKEVGDESALRRPLHHVPVEFFVKPLAAGGRLDQEVNKVNTAFGRKGVDLDQPVSSDDEAWHSIDGLRAGWIALQPDSETEERLQREYKASPRRDAWREASLQHHSAGIRRVSGMLGGASRYRWDARACRPDRWSRQVRRRQQSGGRRRRKPARGIAFSALRPGCVRWASRQPN